MRLEDFTRVETFGDNASNITLTNDAQWIKVLVDPSSREVFAAASPGAGPRFARRVRALTPFAQVRALTPFAQVRSPSVASTPVGEPLLADRGEAVRAPERCAASPSIPNEQGGCKDEGSDDG